MATTCAAARANACWVHRWSGQKETQGERESERERGNERVGELMLTTDVCHSSLIAVALFLALYQTHNRRNSCITYILKLISTLCNVVRLDREISRVICANQLKPMCFPFKQQLIVIFFWQELKQLVD